MSELMGIFELAMGDKERARELMLRMEPDWTDPGAWDKRILNDEFGGCVHAWVLMHTGDEELGRQLLDKALDFQENQLPAAMEHADRYRPEICYLAGNDIEKALASLETQLAHGHLFAWQIMHRMPMYDLIRLEPRYQEIMAERQRLLEKQAALIAVMDAEAGP